MVGDEVVAPSPHAAKAISSAIATARRDTPRVCSGWRGSTVARVLLRADCERCAGLCCVAPAFARSADFAIDKPAGVTCPNLAADFRCTIHDRLRTSGFSGCSAYDCFGAGQRVTTATFAGRDWRSDADLAAQMFAVFAVMRDLHEVLWHVGEALAMAPARAVHGELGQLCEDVERLAGQRAEVLAALDRTPIRQRADALLTQASALVRAGAPGGRDHRGGDLAGRDLQRADLRGAVLVGTCLIGADLSGASLQGADLRGADLRGADLRAANLTDAIFLTQSQVESAHGDEETQLPTSVTRPTHWSRAASRPQAH